MGDVFQNQTQPLSFVLTHRLCANGNVNIFAEKLDYKKLHETLARVLERDKNVARLLYQPEK